MELFIKSSCNQVDVDGGLRDDLLCAIEAFARISGQSCMVVETEKQEAMFISDKLIYIDETMPIDYKRHSPIPYWSITTDVVVNKMLRVYDAYKKMVESMSTEEYNGHICTIDFPIYVKGHCIFVSQRFTPLSYNEQHKVNIGLFTFGASNINEMCCSLSTSTNKIWSYNFDEDVFVARDFGVSLTVAEKAILRRAARGLTNEEIAQELFVSVSTVKTHRNRVFHKLGVKTINEALTNAGNLGLL